MNGVSGSRSPSIGLAVAALVLGLTALPFSLLLVGGALGLLGILFALAHLARGAAGRGMAWWGLVLSVLGILLSACFGFTYYQVYRMVMDAKAQRGKPRPTYDAWRGVPAPDFAFTTTEGATRRLSDYRGKRVVLDFWATWCGPRRKEIPHFVRLVKETSPAEFAVIGISDEDPETLAKFAADNGMNYPVGTAADKPPPYAGIRSIPTTFFIDRNGVIQNVLVGSHDYDALQLNALAPDHAGPVKEPPTVPKPLVP